MAKMTSLERRFHRSGQSLWNTLEDLLYWSRRDNRGGPFLQSEGLTKSRSYARRVLKKSEWVMAKHHPVPRWWKDGTVVRRRVLRILNGRV